MIVHSVDDVYLEQEKTQLKQEESSKKQKLLLERAKNVYFGCDEETKKEKAKGVNGFGSTKNYQNEPLLIYYVVEIARKCLLNPISWVLRGDTMPQNIAFYKPSPKLLFMCCVECYQSAISTFNLLSSEIVPSTLDDDEDKAMYFLFDTLSSEDLMHKAIANNLANLLKNGHSPNIDFDLVEMNIYFQREIDCAMGIPFDEILQEDKTFNSLPNISNQELYQKVDELIKGLNESIDRRFFFIEELIKEETREIPRQINKNKAIDPDFAYIEALLEKPAMIEKKPYTEKYKIIETEKTGTSKKLWKKEAEQRFNKKGLCSKQCWDRLNKKYFVTKNGKPYKNIYSFLNSK